MVMAGRQRIMTRVMPGRQRVMTGFVKGLRLDSSKGYDWSPKDYGWIRQMVITAGQGWIRQMIIGITVHHDIIITLLILSTMTLS